MNALYRNRISIGSPFILGLLILGIGQSRGNQELSATAAEVVATGTPTLAPPQPGEAVPPRPESVLNETASEFEELLRGPLHEAFAEQYSPQPVEGVIADRQPPPLVPEMPPEIRPDGKNVEWLPGYWFWDDERDDFIWISGTWRAIPPGVRWMPGYWVDLGDGRHQWVAGTWVGSGQRELEYIAQVPPETLDFGPVGEAQSANHFWVPGCWQWNNTNYVWRPGYWSVGYANWVWVPARYLWTPRGYVHCAGYWDYPFDARGTLFAPIWFNQPIYAAPGFFFHPRAALLSTVLRTHLWVRPGFRHYYFGDFYALNYRQQGIYPWFGYHTGLNLVGGRRGYDPLFEHYSRFQGGGTPSVIQMNNQFNLFVNQPNLRPPRTFHEQVSWRATSGGSNNSGRQSIGDAVSARSAEQLAAPISELARRDASRYRALPGDQLSQSRQRSEQFPELALMRRNLESAKPNSSQSVESLPLPTSSRSRSTRGPLAESASSGVSPASGQRLQANAASAARHALQNPLQNPLQSDLISPSRPRGTRSALSQTERATEQPESQLGNTGRLPASGLSPRNLGSNLPSSVPRSTFKLPIGSNSESSNEAPWRSLPSTLERQQRSAFGGPTGAGRSSQSSIDQSSSGASQPRLLPSISGRPSRSSMSAPSGARLLTPGSTQSSGGTSQLRSMPSASGGPPQSFFGGPRSSSGPSNLSSPSLRSSGVGGNGLSPSSRSSLGGASSLRGPSGPRGSSGSAGQSSSGSSRSRR
ncbi:MAG: YXWGXW repeat-containing protein [Pirellulaceae bacterium]|nr:YXWGXW repeat-containing protein [Pirellulaceae bacterium]